MPYIYDPNLDKENEDQAGQVQISGSSPTSDPSGSTSSSGGSQTKGANTGSGYQNLDSYINTNDPQKFGQEVVGKVQSDVDTAKQNQSTASDQFKSQVASANNVPTSEDVNKAIANPTGANAQDFQKWQSQSYTGPKSLGEAPDAWNQYWSGTNKADTSTKLLGSEPGRFALLDSYYGRPSYSFGEKSLDNLLLQHGGIGRETKDLQGQAAQLKSQGETQAKSLQDIASAKAGEVEASRNATRAAVGLDSTGQVIRGAGAGALGQQYDSIDAATTAANNARNQAGSEFNSHIASGNLDDQDWKSLGIDQNQSLYNINLNDPRYYTAGNALTKENVMTPEQQAYIKALSQLSGVSDSYGNGTLSGKGSDYNFNKDALMSDINTQKAQYDSDWNQPTVQKAGENATSMQQLQDKVNSIAAAQAKLGNMTPDSWKGTLGNEARDYVARIQAFNDAHNKGRTAGNYAKSSLPTSSLNGGGRGAPRIR